ncbi:SOS response-associated peptidase family protein [Verrucomicrobium sp. BvORR106]|uniref:SOS response-associated peptidase n=1 Tax=Verrucomicrobium sp. BvORR106 TaxID=1403819 RepID=UPI000571FC26|nr:SOS response-associated peptidase family protein [Verrucomicrobium sp. BvORR106]
MCKRYWLQGELEEVQKHIPDLGALGRGGARYNIAPGHAAPVIRRAATGTTELADLIWGLAPTTVTDPDAGPISSLEHHEAAARIGIRATYLYRRCLIPSNGFFIWQQVTPRRSVPWLLSYPGEALMMLAGLWEPLPQAGDAFALLTTAPPNRAAWVHFQFPVILPPSTWAAWLDHDTSIGTLAEIAYNGRQRPNRDLQQWRVTSSIASPDFQDPAAIVPLPPPVR